MIPKVIHFCWFGGKNLPPIAKRCIRSWKKYCPDYEIKRWDEDNYDVNKSAFCKSAYQAGAWAFVSDYARLDIIHSCGGIYLDVDVEIIRSIDELLNNRCYVGVQQIDRKINTGLGFGAEKNSIVTKMMLASYIDLLYESDKKNELACPSLNTAALEVLGLSRESLGESVVELPCVTVYPCEYFDPISMGPSSRTLLTENSFSIHNSAYSWGGSVEKKKRAVINAIGVRHVELFKHLINRMRDRA